MNKLIAALAMIVLATSPAFAAHTGHEGFRDGQRFSGRHPDAFEKHDAFDGHREFDRDRHGRVFIGVNPWFYWADPPAYAYTPPAPVYWYYCPSAGTYYPYVSSCPEPWVPVPATMQ